MKNKRGWFAFPYVIWMALFVVIPIVIMAVYAFTAADPATGEEPYRRRQVVFQERAVSFQDALKEESARVKGGGVRVTQVVESQRDFIPVYDPDHPHANEDGYVMMPNVNSTEERIDLMGASNAYEANLTALKLVQNLALKALEIGK